MDNSADVSALPDLRTGIPASNLRDGGMLAGRVDSEEVCTCSGSAMRFMRSAHTARTTTGRWPKD